MTTEDTLPLFDDPGPDFKKASLGDSLRGRGEQGRDGSARQAAPLAERLRPDTLDQVIGQQHLLGSEGPLKGMILKGQLVSMIFWGPPGVGKTTLARLLAKTSGSRFSCLSAVLSGLKELRQAIDEAMNAAKAGHKTVLFIDEIHRFNKAQQDALLPHVETGLVTLIAATTENPSFEVISALLSRCQVYVLQALTPQDLLTLVPRVESVLHEPLGFSPAVLDTLAVAADGDGRRFLNSLELLLHALDPRARSELGIGQLHEILGSRLRQFDKGGDHFYDQISALHKSVRGSDPDAALYWLTRMLDGGADPLYLGRRLIRMAWEDIGLADPRAMSLAGEAVATYERLGSPEGELALAQCAIYLAVAPKSNAGYKAAGLAKKYVKSQPSMPVPVHLKNAPTRLMAELGHGQGYRYSHDETSGYSAGQNYWPEGAQPQCFYRPTQHGLEIKISEKLRSLREMDAEFNQTENKADSD